MDDWGSYFQKLLNEDREEFVEQENYAFNGDELVVTNEETKQELKNGKAP